MSTYPPRRPVSERLGTAARNPFVAALLGGLVVLLFGVIAVAAGWLGEDKTTLVQGPVPTSVGNAGEGRGLTVNQIYRRDGPGVVFISAQITRQQESPFGFPQEQRGEATGSGFVIDQDGHVMTNAHVVEGAEKIEVKFSDRRTVDARLLGSDASTDVALLKVDDQDLPKALALGDSAKVEVGDAVVAIGNPFGLDRTVTTGIVSALQRQLEAPNGFTIDNVIQTDAAINPGNSGGPLLDSLGRVIGINSQIATGGSGGGSIGIGFAVPINTAKRVADQLREKGRVEHAFLGISGVPITKAMAENLNLPTDRGVLVQRSTGPARKAGVKGGDTRVSLGGADILLGGDVVVAIDGRKVESMNDVIGIVNDKKPSDEVTLELLRGSDKRSVKVTLGDRPPSAQSLQGQGGGQTQP